MKIICLTFVEFICGRNLILKKMAGSPVINSRCKQEMGTGRPDWFEIILATFLCMFARTHTTKLHHTTLCTHSYGRHCLPSLRKINLVLCLASAADPATTRQQAGSRHLSKYAATRTAKPLPLAARRLLAHRVVQKSTGFLLVFKRGSVWCPICL